MSDLLTVLLIGFSIISAAILLVAYAGFTKAMRKSRFGIAACGALLAVLVALQLMHLSHIDSGNNLFERPIYLWLLLLAPPLFYLFSREVLLPGRPLSPRLALTALPLLAPLLLPNAMVPLVAFVVGTGYALWLMFVVYGMRRQSHRFRFELFFFALFAILAVLVLMLGAMIPYLDPGIFFRAYAGAVGLSFVLITAALIIFPELLQDISEAASATYARSTLTDVDVADALQRLERVMSEDELFQNEALNLATLASAVGMRTHQLSELINSSFGFGFSRYVRERRIEAACRLLREDPAQSVLSIGLSSGFRSQSTFYAAFREVMGESPGSYRKKALTPTKHT